MEGECPKFKMDLVTSKPSVLRCAMTGYRRVLYNVKKGKTRRNRLGKCTETKGRLAKLAGSTLWFRRKSKDRKVGTKGRPKKKILLRGEKPIEAVMFVPYTVGSKLKKRLLEKDNLLIGSGQVKYV